MKLYRLNFNSEEQWEEIRNFLDKDESGNIPINKGVYSATYNGQSVEIFCNGFKTIPATFDEDGNELTPVTLGENYEVDVVSSIKLPLNEFIVKNQPSNWHNNFAGEFEIIETIPTMSWLKTEIQDWLDYKGINYSSSDTKSELLELWQITVN